MEIILEYNDLQNLRRWILLTSTAEWIYKKYEFTKLAKPEIYMRKFNPDVYRNIQNARKFRFND
ncbi:hypothetical protein [Aureibaculum luteum]|uniref:hypothetical protein n=1 Tax=Aureibaculum luteum TaxID=1548456 RepID=UPI000E517786|nr:hypothetical protein [Aureibaculum luteum]